MQRPRPTLLNRQDLEWIDISLTWAVHQINQEYRMPTISDQLKAARAQIAEVRQSAANAVAETADASDLVRQEVSKVLKEAADLRAEVAGLTNGGPALDAPAILPAVEFNVTPGGVTVVSEGELNRSSASGENVPGVTTY